MYEVVAGLEPKAVLERFCDISSVPRPSGNQQGISDFLVNYMNGLGLQCRQDAHRNVIACKPASPGYEKAPSVMLQAHMDIISEKNPGVAHDFNKDPIKLIRDGDTIRADGTTLGADDGLGLAFILAVLADKELRHPAIEAVFTADEETDMGGAFGLDYTLLASKLVINLDSNAVHVSGSGELEVEMFLPKITEALEPDTRCFELGISGLRGGHSGKNAMNERGNAVVLLNRVLLELQKEMPVRLISFQGGAGMSSAFAREAGAVIAVDAAMVEEARNVVARQRESYALEFAKRDPGIQLRMVAASGSFQSALSRETAQRLMRLLTILPDGVFSINRDFPKAMESATNTGVVATRDSDIFVTTLIRSSSNAKKYYLYDKIRTICDVLGIRHAVGRDLPHWENSVTDELAEKLKTVYPDRPFETGQGTNECGIFSRNMPGATILGLGAPFYDAHSPNEHFFVSEMRLSWERLLDFLALLKQ